MMISDVVKLVKSTTFIKIISPVIVVILSVVLAVPLIPIGFICAYILELLIRLIAHNYPGFLGYSGYFFMFLVLTISFFGIFKMIFKLEKNPKPNIFDHIRLCGLLYIADIYFVSTFLELSGKHLVGYTMEASSEFGSLLASVLLSSIILANIIAIILIRRRKEAVQKR